MKKKLGLVLLSLGLLLACRQEVGSSSVVEKANFIYLSHTRLDTNDGVYEKIYDIDFSKFEMTLLGGDLAKNSFSNAAITKHLDSVFDFKSPQTLWSIGNHDTTSDALFLKTTLKNKFHVYKEHDVTFITLDSQDSLSSIVEEQREFLDNTLGDIETSSVLIMVHKLIFMNGHPEMDAQIGKVCNAGKGDCFYCHNPNNFQSDIVPMLEALRARGVQVVVVGGDLGYKQSSYEYVDASGITYLGNGVWYPKDGNTALLFSKSPKKPLSYSFVAIDSLLQIQKKNTD